MLDYYNLGVPGLLTFADRGRKNVEEPDVDSLLCAFLDLYKGDLLNGQQALRAEQFAKKHGALGTAGGVTRPPAGFMTFLEKTDGQDEPPTLFVEKEADWRAHSLAMRDMLKLHAFAHSSNEISVPLIKALYNNLMVFEDSRVGRMCLYHGTDGSLPLLKYASRPAWGSLPAAVREFVSVLGSPFVYIGTLGGRSGSVGDRAAWAKEHAEAMLKQYLSAYLKSGAAAEGTLLSLFQKRLVEVLAFERPVSFCVYCDGVGKGIPPSRNDKVYDSDSCRVMMGRSREKIKAVLESSGWDADEAEAVLQLP